MSWLFIWSCTDSLLVFLGEESSGPKGVPYYPTPKLGDWGLVRKMDQTDENNPENHLDTGTVVYMAPVSSRPFLSRQCY